MTLPDPIALVASIVTLGLAVRYGFDAVLRLFAGITAIVAKDPKQSRAERALDVLRTLRRGDQLPPPADELSDRPCD